MILIIIKFCELLLRISPRIINSLRGYIKHSKECFLLFPNTSKLVKKNSAAPRFSNLLLGVWKSEETLFLMFDLLLKKPSYQQPEHSVTRDDFKAITSLGNVNSEPVLQKIIQLVLIE